MTTPSRFYGVGPKEGGEGPRLAEGGGGVARELGQLVNGVHKPALAGEDGRHDDDNPKEHDNPLDKVADGGGHVPAEDDVNRRKGRHYDDADGVGDVEGHLKQPGKAVVDRGGVGDQEDEDDDRGGDFKGLGVKPLFKKIRHRRRPQMLGHNPRPPPQHHPGQQAADGGVAQPDPGGGEPVFPAELTGVPDKDDRRKIARPVGKGGQPRPDRPAPQDEARNADGMAPGGDAYRHHAGEKDNQQENLDYHNGLLNIFALKLISFKAIKSVRLIIPDFPRLSRGICPFFEKIGGFWDGNWTGR